MLIGDVFVGILSDGLYGVLCFLHVVISISGFSITAENPCSRDGSWTVYRLRCRLAYHKDSIMRHRVQATDSRVL